MMKAILLAVLVAKTFPCFPAEYRIDPALYHPGLCSNGFVSVLSGSGKPGEWKIANVEVPPAIKPLSDKAPKEMRPAFTQTVPDYVNERFPILLETNLDYTDFSLTTRFKNEGGRMAQAAGIAFRARDEKNYYVVCASTLDNYFRFYKSVNGVRSVPIGRKMPIAGGVWHELKVSCKGSEILCWLDGQEALPPLNDTSFTSGKVGFWTKSDSESYFMDTLIDYTPTVGFAEMLLRDTLKKYPHLLGLKIFTMKTGAAPKLIASDNPREIGIEGGITESNVIRLGQPYYLKVHKTVEVTVPLRDRNGELAGAARVLMKSFRGETQLNALGRAIPIRRSMEEELATVTSLESDWQPQPPVIQAEPPPAEFHSKIPRQN